MERSEDLNYDFQQSFLGNLENLGDRQCAVRCMEKLTTFNKSIEEMKLRNDFMYHLVSSMQNQDLRPPFTGNPKPNVAKLLPSGGAAVGRKEGPWELDKEGEHDDHSSSDGILSWAENVAADIKTSEATEDLTVASSKVHYSPIQSPLAAQQAKPTSPFHFSPIKIPPPAAQSKERSPFNFSPIKTPPAPAQTMELSPFHYSSPPESPLPPPKRRVETTTVVEPRTGAAPRDSWRVITVHKNFQVPPIHGTMERSEDLNYDFNYNMFLAKSFLGNLENLGDRQRAVRWMKKLTTFNKSIEEMKLRNDFMYYLVLSVQNKDLQPPFTENPPPGPMPNLASLLPGCGAAAGAEEGGWELDKEGKDDKPMLYQSSPDGGAFLAAQPIPRCGAFCYLAVVSRCTKKPEE